MGQVFSFGGVTYRDIEQVSAETHSRVAIKPDARVELVRGLATCPLVLDEMEMAARDFPIVFSSPPNPSPIAVLTAGPGRSPFLKDGEWSPTAYVPRAVRRYPFLLSKPSQRGTHTVFVDAAALGAIGDNPGQSLFDKSGAQTEYLTDKINDATQFQQAMLETGSFMEIVQECSLLHRCDLSVPHPGGGADISLGPVTALDRKRLLSLPDAVILHLHKAGYLAFIHAHFLSLKPFVLTRL